jgi:hypothetical protein
MIRSAAADASPAAALESAAEARSEELDAIADAPCPGPKPKTLDGIRACEHCGFPISESRKICLDCEAQGIGSPDTRLLKAAEAATGEGGIKSWVISNRYIIGMVLISAATIAFALLR